MADEPQTRARALIDRLRAEGAPHHAEPFATHLATQTGHGLMAALREACETLLTAIEAIDPKTRMMAEELRLSVESHLMPKATQDPPA
jgi:hypothetical protein